MVGYVYNMSMLIISTTFLYNSVRSTTSKVLGDYFWYVFHGNNFLNHFRWIIRSVNCKLDYEWST